VCRLGPPPLRTPLGADGVSRRDNESRRIDGSFAAASTITGMNVIEKPELETRLVALLTELLSARSLVGGVPPFVTDYFLSLGFFGAFAAFGAAFVATAIFVAVI